MLKREYTLLLSAKSKRKSLSKFPEAPLFPQSTAGLYETCTSVATPPSIKMTPRALKETSEQKQGHWPQNFIEMIYTFIRLKML